MTNLEAHAEKELRLAGLFEPDSDYGGAIGEAVMKLVRVFASEGHSGGSAQLTLAAFERVARFKSLTPITDDPAEWMDVTDMGADGSPPLWQNRRQSSCFSNDGGKTYYDVDAGDGRAVKPTAAASKLEGGR